MEFNIVGEEAPIINMEIGPGDEILAEAGKLLYKSVNVNMETLMVGGIAGAFKRFLTNESIFMTKFTSPNGPGIVAFAPDYPGKIDVIDLSKKGSFILEKDAFLCGESPFDINVVFTKRLGAALFGGEGFIMEKIEGKGRVFIHSGGDFVRYNLSENQQLHVDPGCFVGCDTTVDYEVTLVKGIKSMLFGGEGLFLLTLTGPGEVILQSLPINRLIMRIQSGMPEKGKGILGSIFNR